MTKELTPPDLNQCQADKPGNGPFTMGGEIGNPRDGYRVRCRNKPTCIAIEREPGADDQVGSMSLCDECRGVLEKTMPGMVRFAAISHTPEEAWARIAMRMKIDPPVYHAYLTVRAREALIAAGNHIKQEDDDTWLVVLTTPVPAVVVTCRNSKTCTMTALRLQDEPPWRDEFPAPWHEIGDWVACPKCGAALVWYEAGYVPGYRICLRGHHAQLARDGRSAEATERTGFF